MSTPACIRNAKADANTNFAGAKTFGRFALFAAVAAAALTGAPLHADPFKPIQAQKVDLGALAGVAYYTVELDGYRLVVTLQAPESGTPFRVVTTLAPEQAVTLSVPRGAGEPSVDVRFVRNGEGIEMNAAGVAPRLAAQDD
jgi:hypothetical protein